MNLHALLPALYTIGLGILIGTAIGYCIRGLFVNRQLTRREREAWSTAQTFYENLRKQEQGS